MYILFRPPGERRIFKKNSFMFTTPEMAAIFAPAAHIRQMLAFEAALARAEAAAGVIPAAAVEPIAAACRGDFDSAAIYAEAAVAGTPAIPLVRQLRARVAGGAADYVHWGATSQDAIDSAAMLQMRAGLKLLLADLLAIGAHCAALAQGHRRTLQAGRTLLQHALPITFGLKAARWLALVTRQIQALRQACDQSLALQFGGAAGTLAALGDAGPRVAELLADELGLPLPDLPWHAERDRIAVIAAAVGIAAGSVAKIAHDIVLLAQTEVGEVAEESAAGKGGSSALPHKRNPADAMQALAAARLATGVVPVVLSALAAEHERAVGGWQAEWAAIPDLFRYAAGSIAHTRDALLGLQIDSQRMRANLDLGGGLIMAEALTLALSKPLGRSTARQIVQEACDQARTAGSSLRQAAHDDPRISAAMSPDAIEQALDPSAYLGSVDMLIDRALASYREVAGRESSSIG
jgi:3-carboxy-cis,cis-muconate cycloisomerase